MGDSSQEISYILRTYNITGFLRDVTGSAGSLTVLSSKLRLSSPSSSPCPPSPSSNKEQTSCPTMSTASTPVSFSNPSFAHKTFPAAAPSPFEGPRSRHLMPLLFVSVRLRTAPYCSEPRARSKRVRQGRLDLSGETHGRAIYVTYAII